MRKCEKLTQPALTWKLATYRAGCNFHNLPDAATAPLFAMSVMQDFLTTFGSNQRNLTSLVRYSSTLASRGLPWNLLLLRLARAGRLSISRKLPRAGFAGCTSALRASSTVRSMETTIGIRSARHVWLPPWRANRNAYDARGRSCRNGTRSLFVLGV